MTSSWKQQLIELESLTKSNGKNAYRTANLIRELWNNDDFLTDADSYDEVERRLSKYSGRFCLSVAEMIAMLENFPSEDKWESGRLDVLRQETARDLAKRTKKNAPPSRGFTNGPTHHVEFDARDGDEKNKASRRQLVSEMQKLRKENKGLREENQQLKATLRLFVDDAAKATELVGV